MLYSDKMSGGAFVLLRYASMMFADRRWRASAIRPMPLDADYVHTRLIRAARYARCYDALIR